MGPAPRSEAAIGAVLRVGVAVSLAFIAAGTVLSFAQRGGYGAGGAELARLIGRGGSFPRTGSWLLSGLLRLDGQAVIVAGLLLLIATPLMRVAVSVVAFGMERDRAYVAISATVLILLLLSFAIGSAG